MAYGIARLLQLAGLIILPVAVFGNVSEQLNLKDSLSLSGVGMILFLAGWVLQQRTKGP